MRRRRLALDIENTGTAPIPDLVVVDPIPDGLDLDQTFAGGAPGQPFRITYNLPAGVAPPTNVIFETVPDPIDPNRVGDRAMELPRVQLLARRQGDIDFQVLLAPGTPANTMITNVAGVSSSRPDVACTPDGANDGTVTDNPAFGPGRFCTSSTTITSLQGTAFSSAKWVSGDESLGWVYTLDDSRPRVALDDPRCPRLIIDGETYTRYPCAAIMLAGNNFQFLLRMTNLSNEAFAAQIAIVDRLPEIGDTGVILTGQARGTEWDPRPLLGHRGAAHRQWRARLDRLHHLGHAVHRRPRPGATRLPGGLVRRRSPPTPGRSRRSSTSAAPAASLPVRPTASSST